MLDHSVSLMQLGLSLLGGALSTLSPCVFPLLPVVVAGVAHAHHRTGPIAMGVGMVFAFVVAGVALAAVGPALGIDSAHLRTAAGLMLLLVAGVMFVPEVGEHTPGWLSSLASMAQRLSNRIHPETLPGAFILGALLGIVWSPCSGPLLGSGIALVATEGGLLNGALILGVFGVGAALPLMTAAYVSRAVFARMRRWVIGHGTGMRRSFAVLIALMGVAVLTGADRWLEAELMTMLPDWWLEMTTRY